MALVNQWLLRRALRRERIFFDTQNPMEMMPDDLLMARYSFPRKIIFKLLDIVEPLIRPGTGCSNSISALMQLLIALRFYVSGSLFNVDGDIHGVSKATVSRVVYRISCVLSEKVNNFISFPTDANEIDTIKQQFYDYSGFPRTIGIIDCTHVPIKRPVENDVRYVNRKNFHSINCQVIEDADLLIRNAIVKWPGSSHDSFILNQSAVAQELSHGVLDHPIMYDLILHNTARKHKLPDDEDAVTQIMSDDFDDDAANQGISTGTEIRDAAIAAYFS
ncbi:unnamed protein product [Didymodactylos carnosus]|uniref:Putative nuclease HARBI1 n=1 Tax=Didymodactylos carnosus TaxID=1234261 RepID=A0A8S2EJT9_9BILA|nr:unnamed protein product [Didymodactylos carnosus]CAF4009693.1 unnamed protein product [Didymodactylos carnosus]CAF4442051.1 unnamed protein product [Didymodactylos carnosus]